MANSTKREPSGEREDGGIRAWLDDYDAAAAECEDREREEKARAFQWYRLMRKTYPDTSNEKHVLRMIADHADIDTGTCCVKVSTICRETLLKPTAVKTAIRGLVELGIIERTNRIRARGGGKAANRYRILPSNPCEIG